MNNSASQDRRRHNVVGELTGVTPPSDADRHIAWFAKARRSGFQFLTGDLQQARARAYERQELLSHRYPEVV